MEFRTADHSACLQEGQTTVWNRSAQRSEEALAAITAGAPVQYARQMQWAINTGYWMKVKLSTVNGIELGAQEWRYALFLQYGIDPPDLPN